MDIEFEGTVHRWRNNEGIFLVSLPKDLSDDIKEISEGMTNGWGSLKVEAKLGSVVWRTSIFPDPKTGCFDLPLKAEVRKKNNIDEGSEVKVQLDVLGF
ncbi:DUF1905 domain-containing protein [Rhodoluna sp. KAS3]|uniref:DUF1905 domain-containing protein n=1 Tax=Rhodoluna sp. KAS3 TaxID=942880 RepID=UPI002232C16E|nr:DUF1905 domain-containing protein [Rhodoluna sp. KAS3]BDS49489.1 hypothetical protein RKAS3_10660 [Rhodoluna sp. KAS3]